MGRSLKKGPFVNPKLFAKVERQVSSGSKEPIKTWARACTIVPEFVGFTFMVHNGKAASQGVRHRRHGRTQVGRVFSHADVPRSRRQGSEEVVAATYRPAISTSTASRQEKDRVCHGLRSSASFRPHQCPQSAPAGGADPRQTCRRGPRYFAIPAAARRSAVGKSAQKRLGQRRRSPRSVDAELDRRRRPRRWRSDVQAHSSAGTRHGLHDQEAHVAHPRNGRCAPASSRHRAFCRTHGSHAQVNQIRGFVWVKKSIRSVSVSESWKAGRAAGMPRSRNSAACCSRT